MKNIILGLLAGLGATSVGAQVMVTTNPVVVNENIDSLLPRFCIDVNYKVGAHSQDYTMANLAGNYNTALGVNIANPKYTGNTAYGFDAQAGYFLGKKRNWGFGIGFLYLSQSGTLAMDNYQIDYQANDFRGDIYRQRITATQPVKESITSTNMNIPIVLKYKKQLGKRLGVTGDLGIMYNVQMQNKYTSSAAFDYEAIYKRQSDGSFVYDNAATPDYAHDWLITKAEYTKTDPNNVAADFAALKKQGYNVALNGTPAAGSGTVSYASGSFGLLFKPSITYRINRSIYADLGGFYLYQGFSNSSSNYKLTDNVGSYNSMMNGATKVAQSTYGLNLGLRFYFYGGGDRDGDGIKNRKDKCPDIFGLKQFDGCPDIDMDGIPDKNDSCPTIFGIAKFNGCPDTDGDGIPDSKDRCPKQAGTAKFNGCPDTDGDGIADIDDKCPYSAGLAKFGGCPDTDGDGIPDNEDNCPTKPGPKKTNGCPLDTVSVEQLAVSTVNINPERNVETKMTRIDITSPVLFDVNKFVIKESSKPILKKAAEELKASKEAYVVIEAYTDATGPASYNKRLSQKRADAVKKYLSGLGVSTKKVKTIGHGAADPIAPNNTEEGRRLNRRSILKLEHAN